MYSESPDQHLTLIGTFPLNNGSKAARVSGANANVVELHTWNSTTDDIAHPDRVIFDLDPGEGIAWDTLKEAAQRLARLKRVEKYRRG